MKVLLVSATPIESAALRQHFGLSLLPNGMLSSASAGRLELHLLHTGIGMVNTAGALGRVLQPLEPTIAIQFGIAGAFLPTLQLQQVVEVVQDCYAELGADSPQGFLGLEEMGFANFVVGDKTYYNKVFQPKKPMAGFVACRGITVNRVSGRADRIEETQQIWNADVETMEGAPFFQACLQASIPFRAFRAISNRVEPRNRATWQLHEAVAAMQASLISLLIRYKNEELDL